MKSFEHLRPPLQNLVLFPQVITPMKNGQLIFYPKIVKLYEREPNSYMRVEYLKKNQGFDWSPISFPFNISDETDRLFILTI